MEAAAEIAEWLDSLPYGAMVGVDDGGLCLRAVVDGEVTGAYYDIGGIPTDDDDEDIRTD